jgi:hypothetical protein
MFSSGGESTGLCEANCTTNIEIKDDRRGADSCRVRAGIVSATQ